MPTNAEITLLNARTLALSLATDSQKTGITAFAIKVGIDTSHASQLIGVNPTKKIGRSMARRIENAFGLPEGWLDIEHSIAAPPAELTPCDEQQITGMELVNRITTALSAGRLTQAQIQLMASLLEQLLLASPQKTSPL